MRAMEQMIETRAVSGTGISISRLGLGTSPLGGLFKHVEEDEAYAAVRAALDVGLTYLDTAPFYGHGTAERRLGAALSGVPRDSYTLSTKVGRLVINGPDGAANLYADAPRAESVFDFTADGIRRSLEQSLERLGLDRVDIAYLHDPDDHVEQALTEAYPALDRLRAEGVVRAIGIGMNQTAVPARFVTETDIDLVLLAGRHTLLDHSGLTEVHGDAALLPLCEQRGIPVVIGGVFNSGILAAPRPGAMFQYRRARPNMIDRAFRLSSICARHGVPLRAAALRYPLGSRAVVAVLAGCRSAAEVEENAALFRMDIPDALWEELASEGFLPRECLPRTEAAGSS